ncbi:MAG: DUF748 domain-containing protein [Candidatus Omnitrophica bacterium]|nr:DUF748 domain-containing protein [Candidatus Omnitrophota bacterium]
MKNIFKIFLALILLLFISFVCLHIFINLKGKSLLTAKLQQTFKRKTEIGRLSTTFPLNIYLKGVEVEGLFKIDEVYARVGVFAIFRRNFKLSLLKLSQPEVNVKIHPKTPIYTPVVNTESSLPAAAILESKKEFSQKEFALPGFWIGHLVIKDGKINFTHKISKDKSIFIVIKDINARIENLNLTPDGSQITRFKISGKIPWGEDAYVGKMESSGWINLLKKDIDATIKITDIDGVHLYPYYSKWVDLEKARIEKAKLNFSSEIKGQNNDVIADCHLELTDIVRRPLAADKSEEKAAKIADAVLDIFRALNEGKIVLDFKIKTKLDYPRFSFEDIKEAMEKKISLGRKTTNFDQIALLPANLIRSTVRGFTGMFRAVFDSVLITGREFSKTLKDTLRIEPRTAQ